MDIRLSAISDPIRSSGGCPSLPSRSEEHTSELQSPCNLVCRLLLEKKKKQSNHPGNYHIVFSYYPFFHFALSLCLALYFISIPFVVVPYSIQLLMVRVHTCTTTTTL